LQQARREIDDEFDEEAIAAQEAASKEATSTVAASEAGGSTE
jgi:hypothetical protein